MFYRNLPQGMHQESCFHNGSYSYFLFVEQKVLCSVPKFTKTLMLWFAVHYILNLYYWKRTKELAVFMEEFAFGLPDNSKKTSTYV